MDRLTLLRRVSATALGLAAIGLGTTLHIPALAAAEYQQLVTPLTASSCTNTLPCLQWTNLSTGSGVQGISKKGNGMIGQTSWKSTSAKNAKAGVLGQDLTNSAFNFGVLGSSSNGTGVQGTSTYGAGVQGTSTNDFGVLGTSINGFGVMAKSQNGTALFVENTGAADGIQSIALNNDGTNSSTQNNSSISSGRSGIWGHDDSTDGGHGNVGVAGSSTTGIGVSASSSNFVALNAIGGGFTGVDDVPAFSVVAGPGGPVFLMYACSNPADNPCTTSKSSKVFTLNSSGDIFIAGLIHTSGACSSGCAVGGTITHRVVSYAPSQSVPSMDDFGEAQLIGGHAYVRLSADFANVVDRAASYLVFITPEGNSRGLYVTDKTQAGFTVRENEDGHSTLAFSYRIVAKPLGVNKPRLPMESVGPRAAPKILRTR